MHATHASSELPLTIPRVSIAPGLEISRVLTGLWQIADMERGGQPVDPVATARDFVASRHSGITVRAATDGSAVTVRVQRRVTFRLPVIGNIRFGVPLVASSTMAIEPPITTAPQGTSVTP